MRADFRWAVRNSLHISRRLRAPIKLLLSPFGKSTFSARVITRIIAYRHTKQSPDQGTGSQVDRESNPPQVQLFYWHAIAVFS